MLQRYFLFLALLGAGLFASADSFACRGGCGRGGYGYRYSGGFVAVGGIGFGVQAAWGHSSGFGPAFPVGPFGPVIPPPFIPRPIYPAPYPFMRGGFYSYRVRVRVRYASCGGGCGGGYAYRFRYRARGWGMI